MEDLRRDAFNNITNAQEATVQRHERTHQHREFQIGDKVMSRKRSRREDSKTGERYDAPFEVLSKRRDIYELKLLSSGKLYQRHVSSLETYHERSTTPERPSSPILINLILAILGLILLIPFTMGQLDLQPRILNLGSEYHVRDLLTKVDLVITVTNPCNRISLKPKDGFASIPKSKIKTIANLTCDDDIGCWKQFPYERQDGAI